MPILSSLISFDTASGFMTKALIFCGIASFVLGIVFLCIARLMHKRLKEKIALAFELTGTVVEFESGREDMTAPVVEVVMPSGQKVRFTASIFSKPQKLKTGDPVQVLYTPDSKPEFTINSSFYLWFTVRIFYFIGCWGLIAPFIVYFLLSILFPHLLKP